MRVARDFMTPNPVCIQAESDVQEAVDFFLRHHVSSAPVVDSKGGVLGQLSELALMRAMVIRQTQEASQRSVSNFRDFLLTPQFVGLMSPLPEVVKALLSSPLHRVLVQDAKGNLAGIISPKDVLRLLNGGAGQPMQEMLNKARELEMQAQTLQLKLNAASQGLQQFTKIFEASAYMMHSADSNGILLQANPILHEKLEYNPGELIGKSLLEIYPPYLHETVRNGLNSRIKEGHHETTYSSFITRSGKVVRVEVVSSSLLDANGTFIGTFSISRPIDSEHLLRSLHGVLYRPETEDETSD